MRNARMRRSGSKGRVSMVVNMVGVRLGWRLTVMVIIIMVTTIIESIHEVAAEGLIVILIR